MAKYFDIKGDSFFGEGGKSNQHIQWLTIKLRLKLRTANNKVYQTIVMAIEDIKVQQNP